MNTLTALPLLLLATLLTGCGDSATLPVKAGQGPDPALPPPVDTLVPTVHIAPASAWPPDATPLPGDGLAVSRFADGLDHPRSLYVLPNGDVLVAESNAQPKSPHGIRERIMRFVMKRAGAGVPSADRITLLRDSDGDGKSDLQVPFLDNLVSPFGMALVNDTLYVANTDALVAFPYTEGQTRITAEARVIAPLPAGPINHHWTKSLLASEDGRTLYVGVGSNSNVGENGLDAETRRAAILAIDATSGETRVFGSGLRNPVGMDWQPDSGELWVAVNERDEIGSDLVPDYMTSVSDGEFFGWPWSYYGDHVDTRVDPPRPDKVSEARQPDYALGAHTASLGLEFARDNALGERFGNGVFIGQHGSWNRKPRSGYQVIFVPFSEGEPDGMPEDILTGFVDDDGKARGRPVDVAEDGRGGLLVTDDVGNIVWRVTATGAGQPITSRSTGGTPPPPSS